VTCSFWLILVGLCGSPSKLFVHVLYNVTKSLEDCDPCKATDDRPVGTLEQSPATAKETRKNSGECQIPQENGSHTMLKFVGNQ
jgi:hypothetical protein